MVTWYTAVELCTVRSDNRTRLYLRVLLLRPRSASEDTQLPAAQQFGRVHVAVALFHTRGGLLGGPDERASAGVPDD